MICAGMMEFSLTLLVMLVTSAGSFPQKDSISNPFVLDNLGRPHVDLPLNRATAFSDATGIAVKSCELGNARISSYEEDDYDGEDYDGDDYDDQDDETGKDDDKFRLVERRARISTSKPFGPPKTLPTKSRKRTRARQLESKKP